MESNTTDSIHIIFNSNEMKSWSMHTVTRDKHPFEIKKRVIALTLSHILVCKRNKNKKIIEIIIWLLFLGVSLLLFANRKQ